MSRLAPLDRALLLILVPLWVVCFGLGVRTQIEARQGAPFIGVSRPDADGHPVLTGKVSGIYPSNPLDEAGLRAGDRLLSVGGSDLRGVGGLGFVVRSAEGAEQGGRRVALVYQRRGERHETALRLSPFSTVRPWLAISFSFVASALLLILRARQTPAVRAYFHAQLSVGVGIATGEAFVGNIRAVDRMIWSAIGNTTNLAARLQGLTRRLHAALVIDATTWQRAEAAAAGFEKRPAVPIRGRRETQDVYALPLEPAP